MSVPPPRFTPTSFGSADQLKPKACRSVEVEPKVFRNRLAGPHRGQHRRNDMAERVFDLLASGLASYGAAADNEA
jgi:hypothetical protein